MRLYGARVSGAMAVLVCALAGSSAAHAGSLRARVDGTFTMRARVTTAVNVRGEHVGESLTRRWVIAPSRCHGDVCDTLHLDRERSHHIDNRITLHRDDKNGSYTGTGSFYVALSCLGRTYRRGSRAPYRITLRVTRTTLDGGVTFAKRIAATYVDSARTDATRCPLGLSHDAARYRGGVVSGLPTPPSAAFSSTVDAADDTAAFVDTSRAGVGARRLVSRRWTFGDPASGFADHATAQDPLHHFPAPGSYRVTLTETDAAGLSTTRRQLVTAPPPPPSMVTRGLIEALPAPAPMRRRGAGAALAPAR